MKTPISASIQSSGAVYLYDQNGHYAGSRRPRTGKAVSAVMNGNLLIISTESGKNEVYKCKNNSIVYQHTR